MTVTVSGTHSVTQRLKHTLRVSVTGTILLTVTWQVVGTHSVYGTILVQGTWTQTLFGTHTCFVSNRWHSTGQAHGSTGQPHCGAGCFFFFHLLNIPPLLAAFELTGTHWHSKWP